MTDKLNEFLKIADIHVDRINFALRKLNKTFPLQENEIVDIDENDIPLFELLVSRFAKLQDFIGRKIIDEYLQTQGEYAEEYTMLDKLNLLEKFGIIESVQEWQKMREVRNHLTHEYPDHPEFTLKYMNQLYDLTPKLILIFERIKKSASKNHHS